MYNTGKKVRCDIWELLSPTEEKDLEETTAERLTRKQNRRKEMVELFAMTDGKNRDRQREKQNLKKKHNSTVETI